MGDYPPLFVLIPMVFIVKFIFWITVYYTCSKRYRNLRTTIIQQTVPRASLKRHVLSKCASGARTLVPMQVEDDNGITGIENPGYMRSFVIETPDHNATHPVLVQSPYDHNTISPCVGQNYR